MSPGPAPSVLDALLPPGVIAVEAHDDSVPAPLFPAEEELIARAVPVRRREFATGRRCARQALAALGHPPAPLLTGERGAPLWPDGVAGAITHCAGYRAAVVAPTTAIAALGLDAEPAEPLPEGVLEVIARPEELVRLAELHAADPGVPWDRLLFCAKEAVYKAWFPLTRRWLGFEEASITFDRATGAFAAELLVDATADGVPPAGFQGRYLVDRGLLFAAVAMPAPGPETVQISVADRCALARSPRNAATRRARLGGRPRGTGDGVARTRGRMATLHITERSPART